jgi:hypothetical protein
MTKIEHIWESLEKDNSLHNGLIYKRYAGNVIPDIYVSLKLPAKLRCLAVHVNTSLKISTKNRDKFKGIKLEYIPDQKNSTKQFLLILLLSNDYKDIFSILCEDLILSVTDVNEEYKLIQTLISRLEDWHLLFEKLGGSGLSKESQRGLYGELLFLRMLIKVLGKPEYCLKAWSGSEKAVQDFQYSDWAVEVKTSSGKNHQKLHIANERQLDTTHVPNIFLVHFSLEVREDHGETLLDIIDELSSSLSGTPSVLRMLKLKLLEAGCFRKHYNEYSYIGYSIRKLNIFRITDDFPRIVESMIPPGVGDVKYSIIISGNKTWTITESELFDQINW